MAQVWTEKSEEKIFFLVAMTDVMNYLAVNIMPAFMTENRHDCLVKCSSLEELQEELIYWELYCKQYGDIQFRFYVDERIPGLINWATSFEMHHCDATFKPVHKFLKKLTEVGLIREKLF